jgi:hypothetical protein
MVDEKDRELREMSRFMATLKDVLHDMAKNGGDTVAEQLNNLQLEQSPDILLHLVSELNTIAGLIDERALQVALKEQEREIDSLKEKIHQLAQFMASRGMLIDLLTSLNVDLVQTLTEFRQLIHEKDQVRLFGYFL